MAIPDDPRLIVEHVARESYGRLIAFLSARTGDVAAAEDALGDAFVTALHKWPHDGVPVKPEAWLLTAARRRLIDRSRHDRVRLEAAPTLHALMSEAESISAAESINEDAFPDERLKLLFVCAHPDIDRGMHTPLMLQVVLGLDAATIASAFLTSPATMGQRLSRAKSRIRDAGIAFEIPDRGELPVRLDAVLDAIYAAYGSGWDDVCGSDPRRAGLAQEAVWLARTLLELLPDEPETRGLLALMLYCEARRPARRTVEGNYVPMSEQDVSVWSESMLDEAEQELTTAAAQRRPGRFNSKPRCSPRTWKACGAELQIGAGSPSCTKDWCGNRRQWGRLSAAPRRLLKPKVPRREFARWMASTRRQRSPISRTGPPAHTCCIAPGAWPNLSRPSIARSV